MGVTGNGFDFIKTVQKIIFQLDGSICMILVFELQAVQLPLVFTVAGNAVAFGAELLVALLQVFSRRDQVEHMLAGNRKSLVVYKKECGAAG